MAASVEQFFQSYAQVLNRSVGEHDGLDAARAHLADSFVVATPDGVRCGQDDEITETLRQMLDLWRAIGVKEILSASSARPRSTKRMSWRSRVLNQLAETKRRHPRHRRVADLPPGQLGGRLEDLRLCGSR